MNIHVSRIIPNRYILLAREYEKKGLIEIMNLFRFLVVCVFCTLYFEKNCIIFFREMPAVIFGGVFVVAQSWFSSVVKGEVGEGGERGDVLFLK